MKSRRAALSGFLAAAVVWLPATARALINPNFTPIHLTDQSELVLKVRLPAKQAGNPLKLEVLGALKGKAPGVVTVDLAKGLEGHPEVARKLLAETCPQTLLLFAGTYDDGSGQKKQVGYLHVGGRWLQLTGGKGGAWELAILDDQMQQTWAGGTDMLLRCVQYIFDSRGDATVPSDGGTAWRGDAFHKVGAMPGKAAGAAAVDLAGDGKLLLYVASPAGDRLLRAAGEDRFEDVTARRKLAAKSSAWAWGDFNNDGRADLASYDGKTLSLWNQAADGTFRAAKAQGKSSLPGKCPPLATIGRGPKAPPALVVSGVVPAELLVPVAENTLKAVALAVSATPPKSWGAPQGCVVGDFNDDTIPDVIQPFETEGLLYPGRADGSFAPGTPCGVFTTKGGGAASVGDFDGDGLLDVFVAGTGGVCVFHNLRTGRFAETLGVSGEVAYKGQPFASGCGVGDFNSDGRQDVFLTYSDGVSLLYFNRGFRSFGEAPQLEGKLNEISPDKPGVDAAVLADFDGDGAEDLAAVLPNGEIWCGFNDLGGESRGLKIRLGPGLPAGPVTVTGWHGKRLLGARQVFRHARPAFIGVEDTAVITLKWQLPGQPAQERKVPVEDNVVDVVIEARAKAK